MSSAELRTVARNQARSKSWHWPISYASIEAVSPIADAGIVVLSSVAAGVLYHQVTAWISGDVVRFLGLAAIVIALFVPLNRARSLYRPDRLLDLGTQLKTVALNWCGVMLFLSAVAFTLKIGHEFSRGSVLSFFLLGLMLLSGCRLVWHRFISRAIAEGSLRLRKILLIGDESRLRDGTIRLDLEKHGIRLMRQFAWSPKPERNGGLIKEAMAYARASGVEEIYVASDLKRWQSIREKLQALPLPVRLLPDPAVAELIGRPWNALGNLTAIELQRAPLSASERVLKRALDIVLASTGLVALVPLFAVVAIAIKLDSPGSVLFRQTRQGFNGKPFKILKFRSMTVAEDGQVIRQASRNDSRVTRVGRWLRRSSIDELPQLLNVLRGEMSIVGPRPHAAAHDSDYSRRIAKYAFRQHVKPGLTGWAQVNGHRGETATVDAMARRIEHDLWYIDHFSLALDLKIIAGTAGRIWQLSARAY